MVGLECRIIWAFVLLDLSREHIEVLVTEGGNYQGGFTTFLTSPNNSGDWGLAVFSSIRLLLEIKTVPSAVDSVNRP